MWVEALRGCIVVETAHVQERVIAKKKLEATNEHHAPSVQPSWKKG